MKREAARAAGALNPPHVPPPPPFNVPLALEQIDREKDRRVAAEEGALVARDHGCLYYETSAKEDLGVQDAVVWGLLAQVMDTPSLLRPPPVAMDMEPSRAHNHHHHQGCAC